MRIFVASVSTETNTFAPIPTGLPSFEEHGLYRGDGSRRAPLDVGLFASDLRRLADADGHEVVESVSAFAMPGGRTMAPAYESLAGMIVDDLSRAGPIDIVALFLHGAMAAESCDDCEGDLLTRLRAIVGPSVVIGAELDLHCHFTRRMQDAADAIICFKEYPHTDMTERAEELYHILTAAAAGRVRPVTEQFDCKMVGIFHTTREPMAGFVRRMQSFEGHDGILSVSLGHGFPWGDVAEGGARLWVIADGDRDKARALATRLGAEFYALRDAIGAPVLTVDDALDAALACEGGPVVLADVADNPGGGAPGDSSFILDRIVKRGIGDVAVGPFWDLGAVHLCRAAGIGARFALRLGGKIGPMSGNPVDLMVTVLALNDAHDQYAIDGRAPFGASALVETSDGVTILIVSIRSQIFGRDAFTGLGLDLATKKIVVVKSSQHFHDDYAPIARAIFYVDTPGALSSNFAAIPYHIRSADYWPRRDDPLGLDPA